jgi:hypothetical protein
MESTMQLLLLQNVCAERILEARKAEIAVSVMCHHSWKLELLGI